MLLLFAVVSSTFGQIQRRQRRKVVQFRQFEVFFDGGRYLISSFDEPDKSLNQGESSMAVSADNFSTMLWMDPTVNDPSIIDLVTEEKSYSAGDFGTSFSAGGGVRYRINPRMGLELRFIFSQHTASSYASDHVVIPQISQTQGDVELDLDLSFDHKYNYHPIILNGYYNFRPGFIRNLDCSIGGGPGVYITTVNIEHKYSLLRTYSNIPFMVEWHDGKAHEVIQNPGINAFGEVQIRGSSVVSIGLAVEYNHIFTSAIKKQDWSFSSIGYSWTGEEEYEYPIEEVLESVVPKKVDMSGFRYTASINFIL